MVNSTAERHILIIEDNPDHALLAKRAIERDASLKVDTVDTGKEGLRKLKSERFDLAVCDYQLPDISGLELLRQVKEEDISVPFIMLTGNGDERIAVTAMRSGAYNYVVKDDVYLHVLPVTVRETMDRYLGDQERKMLEKEIFEKNKQLEKMNQELLRLDQLKNDFIASVSHEFRTPLNAVRESLALVIDGVIRLSDEKKAKDILAIGQKNIDRLSLLIEDLLDINKLESGKVRMDLKPNVLKGILAEVAAGLRELARSRGLEIVVKESNVPEVVCDRNRLIQVLINLVGNAIKFTPAGGQVTVWAETVLDNKVKVCVKDTGIGIDPKLHMKIFERFEQAERSVPGSCLKGTGLGLTICRHIIEQHQGSIWVESEIGKGSTFMFTLLSKIAS